ncbi:hypothetical protein IHE56_15125 [Streptomyces sp. ID01-12c]|uniref:hypothetical protein n=1 Tax=Streptomyces caniscabiei TaxID=2746961 RepID=UPI00177D6FC5|nr:hypothetical protein [Streptomyces caniscabiei]MBD9703389.1 hypothetical protein [Streptomyces caniscabiei]MDX3726879.1 hypothetical protein [Streptomyces caniscabiei]
MKSYQPRRGRLTADQTATLLGITRTNLRLLVHRGKLHRVGGSPRRPEFDVAEVAALQAAREERSGGPTFTQVRGNSA